MTLKSYNRDCAYANGSPLFARGFGGGILRTTNGGMFWGLKEFGCLGFKCRSRRLKAEGFCYLVVGASDVTWTGHRPY